MSIFTRILAMFAIAAFAVGPVSAATNSNAMTLVAQANAGSVTGTAVDETGAPIVGATVTVSGQHNYTGTTDAKGAFTISDIAPGLYTLVVRKSGFDTASQQDFAVVAGTPQQVSITMHTSTFTTLQTIATVRTSGRGTINTSTAAVNTISAAKFADQGTPQVSRVLNQVPGTQISLPQTSADGAVAGAITFPNIRGALSFETASLIDGHPVSVGTFGDYVTTFLNSAMYQGVDVIKGPGAMSPQVNYAIGGTVNFRTKDPTATFTPAYTFGIDNHGGSELNFGISDTLGKLGFVVDVADVDIPGALQSYNATFNPSGGVVRLGGKQTVLGFNDNAAPVPGTVSQTFNQFGLVGCCYTLNGSYNSINELVKFRYKFSEATTATVSYLGGQTWADQNANTTSQTLGLFSPSLVNPGVPYGGSIVDGATVPVTSLHAGSSDLEVNNEPILQAEVRTALGNDTILARYYHASIDRLINQGSPSLAPSIDFLTLNGTNNEHGVKTTYNNVGAPVAFYDYFQQSETDALSGISLEYQHPIGESGLFTLAGDQTNSTTTSYSQGTSVSTLSAASDQFKSVSLATPSVNIPTGSSQLFTTFLARYSNQFGKKMEGTLSLYDNVYRSTVPYLCQSAPGVQAPCAINGSNALFSVNNTSHFDERLGLTYRVNPDSVVRFAAGSAIAPPYLNLIAKTNAVSYRGGSPNATQTVNAGNLLPETAFGYDLGADHRFKDQVTTVSVDGYMTNLFNHFVASTYLDPKLCTATYPYTNTGCPAAGVPMYDTTNINLANSRFEGLEISINHSPDVGFGWSLSGSTQRGYAYNIPASIYCSNPTVPCTPANYNTNLGIVPNVNFTGGGLNSVGPGLNGFSNQNIPYLQGNAEISYRMKSGAYAAFGDTLYGKNNSLNAPPFAVAYATLRMPLNHALALQISGDNIFNQYSGLFPITGAGVGVPLAIPGSGATTFNVLGPATWRFTITKNIGPDPSRP